MRKVKTWIVSILLIFIIAILLTQFGFWNLLEKLATAAFWYKWQTLIGSMLGPFLAVIASAIVAYIQSKFVNSRRIQDSIRTINTSIIQTLNSLYSTRLNLEMFLKVMREIISDVEKPNETEFAQNETNFPASAEIFVNPLLPELQTGSNYIHNQLMFYNAGLNKDNAALRTMKEDLAIVIRKNELSCLQNTPPYQRKFYAENLKAFCDSTEKFNKHLEEGCRLGQQIKIYNEKLGRSRRKTIKEFESVAQPYSHREKWASNIDRVNDRINPEVEETIQNAELGLERQRESLKSQGLL